MRENMNMHTCDGGTRPSFGPLIYLLVLTSSAWAASPSVPGIKNFREVDERIYRGGQPTEDGFRYLANLGVKVVLDLREPGARSAAEERIVTAAGMRYINVPMSGLIPPTEAETNTILRLLEDPMAGPVFVHCWRGADRTGSVIAAYRIDHDGWDNARALKEAMDSGMSWTQFPRRRYITTFHARTSTASAEKADPSSADSANVLSAAPAGARN